MRIQYIFLLLMINVLVGCVTLYNPATGRNETYFIDDRTEYTIGKNMANEILQNNKKITDPVLTQRLNSVTDKLNLVTDRKNLLYHYYILDDAAINAFALPGGYVFVNKGLIDKTNDDQLAFVVSHELGHIAARHSVKRLQNTMGINLLLSIASYQVKSQLINQALNSTYNVIVMGFSRKDELLADSLGLKYMTKAGFDPQGSISLLKLLEQEEKKTPGQLVFLSSHPPASQRISTLQGLINKK